MKRTIATTLAALWLCVCMVPLFSTVCAAEATPVCERCPEPTVIIWFPLFTSDGKDAHRLYCDSCLFPVGPLEPCIPVPGTATCLEPSLCEVCNYAMYGLGDIDPNAHSWRPPEYRWNHQGKNSETGHFEYTCTASRDCSHGCGTLQEERVLASVAVDPPTCTETGTVIYTASFEASWAETQVNDKLVSISALGHTKVTDKAVEATCDKTGLTKGEHCSVCEEILVAQETVPAKGHTEEVLAAKEATCTETGLTEGKKCSVCEEILVAQKTVSAKGHTEKVLAAKDATCTATGLTKGKKCSVCNKILVAQKTIPAKGHTEEVLAAKDATCTETGLTEGKKCSVCQEILAAQETVPAKGHTEEVLAAKEATCTETGLTEGKKCPACEEILAAQEVVPAKGHKSDNACDAECNTCGEANTPPEHYSENADGKCDECGESFELSGSAIAIIVIGAVAVIIAGVLALYWFVFRKKRSNETS